MAILIPSIGSCVSRMMPGEQRLAERLEQKLGTDYLLWYNLPTGPQRSKPNFIVMHPRRGLLILEVRDWDLKTIRRADLYNWQLFSSRMLTTRPNPIREAQRYAREITDALKRDLQLLKPDGDLCFAWSYGVVFSNLTRQEFTQGQLARLIEPQQVLCSDEMLETIEAKDLQSRLWDMFPLMMGGLMTPVQRERVRWILFPELRLPSDVPFDGEDAAAPLPALMPVMALEQERLVRSAGRH